MTLSLWGFAARADVIITTIHSFRTAVRGSQPNTLVLGKDGYLAGWTYQLQYKSDLSSAEWIDLGNPVIATSSTLSAVANGPQRFYRVAVVPQ